MMSPPRGRKALRVVLIGPTTPGIEQRTRPALINNSQQFILPSCFVSILLLLSYTIPSHLAQLNDAPFPVGLKEGNLGGLSSPRNNPPDWRSSL